MLCTMDFGKPKIKEIYIFGAAVEYASVVTKNLVSGCNSGLCSASHFLIMHLSSALWIKSSQCRAKVIYLCSIPASI